MRRKWKEKKNKNNSNKQTKRVRIKIANINIWEFAVPMLLIVKIFISIECLLVNVSHFRHVPNDCNWKMEFVDSCLGSQFTRYPASLQEKNGENIHKCSIILFDSYKMAKRKCQFPSSYCRFKIFFTHWILSLLSAHQKEMRWINWMNFTIFRFFLILLRNHILMK